MLDDHSILVLNILFKGMCHLYSFVILRIALVYLLNGFSFCCMCVNMKKTNGLLFTMAVE